MREYLVAMWRCRYFWLSLARNDLRTRYRRSVLGIGWSLLHPVVMTLVLCTVLPLLLAVPVKSYVPFLFSGLIFWNYLVSVTSTGCQCLFQAEAYIRQYPAPMAIYPLRNALAGTVHFLISLPVALLLSWHFSGVTNPWALISLAPTVTLYFLLVWSTATLAGLANVFFPDTQHLCEDGFQILFFVTPVMYDRAILGRVQLDWILKYNPLVHLLQLLREPVLDGRVPPTSAFVSSAVVVAVVMGLAISSLVVFQKRVIFHL